MSDMEKLQAENRRLQGVIAEWERDMKGTLATLAAERAMKEELLEALDLMTDQYEQICEDHKVMGFPAAVKLAHAAMAKARVA